LALRSLITAAALAASALAPLVGAAAVLLTPTAAQAADNDGDSKGGRGANKDADPGARDARKSARTGDDLESCRRDADGMRGPERSRFMTQCLKDRK
jgi:hypothetical protein